MLAPGKKKESVLAMEHPTASAATQGEMGDFY
jgi:hypothetical protein